MSEMTYTICPVCRGMTWLHGDGVGRATLCPCTRTDRPGWAPTGVTLGQLERMADLERALSGDPGMPLERRQEILARVRSRPGWVAMAGGTP